MLKMIFDPQHYESRLRSWFILSGSRRQLERSKRKEQPITVQFRINHLSPPPLLLSLINQFDFTPVYFRLLGGEAMEIEDECAKNIDRTKGRTWSDGDVTGVRSTHTCPSNCKHTWHKTPKNMNILPGSSSQGNTKTEIETGIWQISMMGLPGFKPRIHWDKTKLVYWQWARC